MLESRALASFILPIMWGIKGACIPRTLPWLVEAVGCVVVDVEIVEMDSIVDVGVEVEVWAATTKGIEKNANEIIAIFILVIYLIIPSFLTKKGKFF